MKRGIELDEVLGSPRVYVVERIVEGTYVTKCEAYASRDEAESVQEAERASGKYDDVIVVAYELKGGEL